MIHPSAIISPQASLGHDVVIGAYAILGDDVIIGDGTQIGPHVVIEPHVTIGPHCHIFQFATIGALSRNTSPDGSANRVLIGANVVIREFVTIHRGTEAESIDTEVGDNSILMAYCHLAHDCRVGQWAVLVNNTTLAGHVTIGDHVTVGGVTSIIPNVRVGDFAFIGGKSAVERDIPPYVIAAGEWAALHGLNNIGLKRNGFSEPSLVALKKTYRILFRYGLTLDQGIERVRAEVNMIPEVQYLIDFIESSSLGVTSEKVSPRDSLKLSRKKQHMAYNQF